MCDFEGGVLGSGTGLAEKLLSSSFFSTSVEYFSI